MSVVTQQVIDDLPISSEGNLEPLLSALLEIDEGSVETLALAALRSSFTMVKEDYVSILEDVAATDAAIHALLSVLRDGLVHSDRGDLIVTIRALRALRVSEAIPVVSDLLAHPDAAVRGAAAGFLFDMDDDGVTAAPAFHQQLARETDPEVMEPLIDGLVRWHCSVDSSLLARLLADPTIVPSLRQSALRAKAKDD